MNFIPAILIFALAALPCTAHASPSLNLLTSDEREYYKQMFDFAMGHARPGEEQKWSSYSGNGSFIVGKSFTSKSKYTCRDFSETYTVKNKPGSGKGYGCKRQGRPGWCKVKEDSALTCALEPPDNFFEQIGRDTDEAITTTQINTNNWMYQLRQWWNSW